MEKKFCYTSIMSDSGFTAGIVIDGESGYHKTAWEWNTTKENADEICKKFNKKLGISEKEANKMIIKSMKIKGGEK